MIQILQRHGVEYIVVGGAAALSYGAERLTKDLDCVPRRDVKNLERLAAAMRELGARLDVEGLTDEESRRLPVQLDARTLARAEITTGVGARQRLRYRHGGALLVVVARDTFPNLPAGNSQLQRSVD